MDVFVPGGQFDVGVCDVFDAGVAGEVVLVDVDLLHHWVMIARAVNASVVMQIALSMCMIMSVVSLFGFIFVLP